jgi:hypothetical protein
MDKPSSPSDPLSGPERITPKGGPSEAKIKPDKEAFRAHMNELPPGSKEVSPMDLAKTGIEQSKAPSFNTIASQLQTTQSSMGDIQSQLNTPNLKFKHSQQKLLESKLTDAKDHLKGAASLLNAEILPEKKVSSSASPVTRFLSYLTDGQNQLTETKKSLESLAQQGKNLTPGQLLLIQVKLSQAQQEIEYSSVLLSKVIDVLKQIINIQI